MTSTEHIRQLLAELAPALNLDGVSEFDERTWVIVRDDVTSLVAGLDDSSETLVLSCELGRPDDECRLATYEAALIANFTASSPAAPRLALNGRDGMLELVQPIAVPNLASDSLAVTLNEMFRQVDQWRNVLARGGVAPEPIIVDAVEDTAALRV